MTKRRVIGASKVRRMMRRLPDSMQEELVRELNVAGIEMLSVMQGRAPARTGALKSGLRFKVFPRTMRLQVGILGKRERSRLFYAHILEFGRKAQEVRARRRTKSGAVSSYMMNVRRIAPKRFVFGGMGQLRERLQRNLKAIYQQALSKVAAGGMD